MRYLIIVLFITGCAHEIVIPPQDKWGEINFACAKLCIEEQKADFGFITNFTGDHAPLCRCFRKK